MNELAFQSARARLGELLAQLHRTNPADGPERLFVVYFGEVTETSEDRLPELIAQLEATGRDALRAFGRKGGAA